MPTANKKNFADTAVPIKTAFTGMACLNCMKGDSPSSEQTLLRCGRCKRAHYCSRNCQKEDWKVHKPECHLLQNLDAVPGVTPLQKATSLMESTDTLIDQGVLLPSIKTAIERHKMFLLYAKVCTICQKTDLVDSAADTDDDNMLDDAIDWKCCPKCNFGWCCSPEHWEQYKDRHMEPLCNLYKDSIAQSKFRWNHVKTHNEDFMYVPDASRQTPLPSFPTDWEDYLQVRDESLLNYARAGMLPEEFIPVGTYLFSQPVMCLKAMYDIFEIETFQSRSNLTIHVVGASPGYELWPTGVWEEILHCLPSVKDLTVVFVGPEATKGLTPPQSIMHHPNMQTCPSCQATGRKRHHCFFAKTYHDFAATSSSDYYSKPDLIVAFNTGMYEEYTESWKESLNVMLDLNIPALLTSYNHYEAEQDIQVLKSLQANLVTEEPVLNPFRSLMPIFERCGTDAFFHANMYYMAFQGRTSSSSSS